MAKRKERPDRPPARRLPAPNAPRPPHFIPASGPEASIAPEAVAELVELQQEVCRASGKSTFTVWRDWLTTLAPWLAAVGVMGELAAQVSLPAEVVELYEQLDERYSRYSARYPAAQRIMGDNFTRMWQVVNQHAPRFDATQPVTWTANPDLIGQAFLTSLNRPATWIPFFPPWAACLELANRLIPDNAAQQVYNQLALGHIRATAALEREIKRPVPGQDELWLEWLHTILPFTDLPLIITEAVTAVTLLPAVAHRFSPWLVRGSALVRFAWPTLANDPILHNITLINAMLMGLNGFYLYKYAGDLMAVEEVSQALAEMENAPPGPPPPPVFTPTPEVSLRSLPPETELPSFADLFRRPR